MNQPVFSFPWMPLRRMLVCVAVIAGLAACDIVPGIKSGGGSDTNAPTADSSPEAPPNAGNGPDAGSPGNGGDPGAGGTNGSPHAGTYNGTVTYTATGLGQTIQDSDPISIVIGSGGEVTVNGQFAGVLTGNSFSISQAGSTTVSGVTCTGTISVSGTVSNNSINGAFQASSLVCNGVPVEFSGTFNAVRTGVSPSHSSQTDSLHRSFTGTAVRLLSR